MSNSTNPYANRRKVVNPYSKKSLQTGYSQQGDNVEPTPVPYSEQNRPGHVQESKPVREGLDPTIYDRKTQSPVSLGTQEKALFTSVYPWFLVPRYTSANVIQRVATNFATINLPDNGFLDVCVLNVSRAEGTVNSATAGVIPGAPPTIPSNALTASGESISGTVPKTAGQTSFPTGSGGTIASAGALATFTPASIGEFYKIACFGHAEVPTATAGITYQLWVDSRLIMEWADFQWSAVTPKIDQWRFEVPLFVEKQIVLRVINETGAAITAGTMEACFSGWSEQKMGFLETDKVQIENTVTN